MSIFYFKEFPKPTFFFKTLIIIVLCVSLHAEGHSQDAISDTIVIQPTTLFRFSFLSPALAVEQKLVRNTTLVFELWAGSNLLETTSNERNKERITVITGLTLQPRIYTDLAMRREAGLLTECYSGTYIGFPLSVFSKFEVYGASAGIVGGFQKKIGNSLFWSLEIGPVMRWYNASTRIVPFSHLRFGLILR